MSLTDGLMQTEEKQQVLGQGQTAARPFSVNATRRRYLVLLAFALNAGSNCFMFMDYNSVPAITKVLYGLCHDDPMAVALGGDGDVGGVGASASGSSSWTTGSTGPMVSPDGGDGDGDRCSGGGGDDCGNSFVGWTYSASLLAVMPAAVPVMAYLGRYNYLVSAAGMACNCAGAWLRYVSAEVAHAGSTDAGQALAILSSVLVGCGAAVIVCSYSAIPARHFPPHERTMATSVAVQANYSGWLVGALLFPYAVCVSGCLVFFLAVYTEGQVDEEEEAEHGHQFGQQLRALVGNRQYLLQAFCYATHAGVSFAIPAFLTSAFYQLGISPKMSAWANAIFIASGVGCGLACGRLCTDPLQFPPLLRRMFLACALGLSAAVGLTHLQDSGLPFWLIYTALMLTMAVCGAASLGFIGIALSAVTESAHPVSGELSSGGVEWLLQLCGAVLAQTGEMIPCQSFVLCCGVMWVVTALMFTLYQQEFRRSARGGSGSDVQTWLKMAEVADSPP